MANLPSLDIAHPVATLTLRRPENANRLEPDDLKAIVAHIAAVNRDPGILVLQIRGEGKHFCSGYDISSLAAQSGNPIGFEDMANAVEVARPATIAVVHGGAYGGGTDLALACGFLTDVVTADELEASVGRLTDTLAAMAPLALLGMKKHLNRIARGALDVDDLNGDIARAADSEDLREGAAAWAARRPPKFTGR